MTNSAVFFLNPWAVSLAALLAVSPAGAESTLSAKEKVALYKSCQKSCVDNQIALESNRAFLELPFVIESYCGCYCTAFSLRLDMDELDLISRLVLEGKSIESNKALSEKMEGYSEACLGALLR